MMPGTENPDSMNTIFSPAIRKAGHELLDHQCWAFGRDILHKEGNLLIERGFVKVRCPEGGLTQYELRHGLGDGDHVFLWGFGAFFGSEKEGVFMTRSGFTPFRTQGRVELHSKDNFPFRDESFDMELLLKGLAWFAGYEDWITHRMCEQYRSDSLKEFPRLMLPPAELAARWRALGCCIAENHSQSRVAYV